MNKTTLLSPPPQRFFGVHFDFHATESDKAIGASLDGAEIGRMLDEVRPDFVQCDSKGHPGISSYPTKIGCPAPGLRGDPLAIWRAETRKRNIPLYVHHSGVWDTCAARQHPEWARVKEDGTRDPDKLSVFGPYARQLLIPQICEMAAQYGIDGVWLDGECWATAPDHAPQILRSFRAATGIRKKRLLPGSPEHARFIEFCREGFRSYLRDYVAAVHARFPDLQVASNWAFSSIMPEPVSAAVDFLSGDYPMRNSVNLARFEARCLQHQGKPWDLMAWGFASGGLEDPAFTPKSAVQLCHEAGITLAAGGGFQVYFRQQRDGGLRRHHIPALREVAAFCRARRKVCHQAESVPQVAVFFSAETFYRKSELLFSAWNSDCQNSERGAMQALLDTQNVTDILMDHHLEQRLRHYPLAVIPDGVSLGAEVKARFVDYVKRGGRLLVTGPASCGNFREELGLSRIDPIAPAALWVESGGNLAGLQAARFDPCTLAKNARSFGRFHLDEDIASPAQPACLAKKLGKGTLAVIPFDCTARYLSGRSHVLRDFLGGVVRRLFPNPRVLVAGSHQVDVCLMRKDGGEYLHLLNTSGAHDQNGVNTFDEITSLGPLEIRLRPRSKPITRLRLLPENRTLRFRMEAGRAVFTLPKLHLHSIIEIQCQA